ncbi:uncharacterized protein STEHIDRAFT_116874, partial [Stereum hirsutum FP-91666 SS1]
MIVKLLSLVTETSPTRERWRQADRHDYESSTGTEDQTEYQSQTYESAAALEASSAIDPLKIFKDFAADEGKGKGQAKSFSVNSFIPTHDFLQLPKWQPTEEEKMTCIKDHRKAQALLQTKSSYNLNLAAARPQKTEKDEADKEHREQLVLERVEKAEKDRKCRQVKQAKPRDNLERLMPAGLKNTYASGTHSGVIGVGQALDPHEWLQTEQADTHDVDAPIVSIAPAILGPVPSRETMTYQSRAKADYDGSSDASIT